MIVDRKAEEGQTDEDSTESSASQFPIFWLTGNTGSGKSTLADAAENYMNRSAPSWNAAARRLIILDGDAMRETSSLEEDLSAEGRRKHNLRVARLAALMQKKGFLVVVSVIAPFEALREEIDAICNPQWIHVHRSGLESKDRPYEEPLTPALRIDTDALSKQEAAESLIRFIEEVLNRD